MTMQPTDTVATQVPPVRKQVTVPATTDTAFQIFVAHPTEWWPAGHRLVADRAEVVFEPRVGGRWYERSTDGSERDWGRVVAWQPPHRIAVTWRIDGRWQPIEDDARASEIEVIFTPAGAESTLVHLAHVKLERHGPDALAIHRAIDGPSPGETLASYAAVVRRRTGGGGEDR